MPDGREKDVWNFTTLREWLQERDRRYEAHFKAQESAMNAALTEARIARDKYESATSEKLEAHNKFADRFMEKSTASQEFAEIKRRIDKSEEEMSELRGGRMQKEGGWGHTIGIVGAACGVLAVIVAVVAVVVSMVKR